MVLNIRTMAVAGLILAASIIFVGSTLAKTNGETRPGWGHGDTNHVHTGPPGQSVHP